LRQGQPFEDANRNILRLQLLDEAP
jgi:hypothetical protein